MPNELPDLEAPTSENRLIAFRIAVLAGGFALFVMMLHEMRGFLNPPVVALAIGVLLWPLRKMRAVRALLVASTVMLLVWTLGELAAILLPFAIMYLFAYFFDPVATGLHDRFRIPRGVTSLCVTALLIGVFAALVFLLVPVVVTEFEVLFRRLVDTMEHFREWLQSAVLLDNLERVGIDRQQIANDLTNFLQDRATALATSVPNILQSVSESIGAVLGAVAIVGVLPVVHYYMLKDYPHIRNRLAELFPTFGGRRDYLMQAGGVVGNYLRGQLLICAIAAFNVSLVLTLFDVPFALLIGIVGGMLNILPSIGIIVTNILGILIGLIFGDPWYKDVFTIVAVLLGQSILEQALLMPRIMSHQVGLHPVLVIISLFVFGHFMGWVGLVIAVPVTALVMTVYRAYRGRLQFELTDENEDPGGLTHKE